MSPGREPEQTALVDPGSFRDPAGGVLLRDGRVYRYFTRQAAAEFEALLQTGLLGSLARSGAVIEARPVAQEEAPELYRAAADVALVVEHPRVPFISYVYEWPFEMLKAAALLHLETLQAALRNGYMLKDATPYNVQFIGPHPLLIDVASFEPYREGMPWVGYSQFCRTFLNPLLLQALTGVPFQGWMRSSLEGIEPARLSPLLSGRHKLRWGVFLDVVLQAWLQRRSASQGNKVSALSKRPIPKGVVLGLVARLTRAIAKLRRRRGRRSLWMDYERQLPYDPAALQFKERFVEEALAKATPPVVWDLGCNLGRYSLIAARYADYVVAMDSDEEAVGALYERIKGQQRNLLPLTVDLLNPSPDQGWAQAERRSLRGRGPADFALCLALVHHLAIGGNVPLRKIAEWLASVARAGVVEFVPKSDPMVQSLLQTRQDVYVGYTQAAFAAALEEHFRIAEVAPLPDSERILYLFAAR